MIFKPRLADGDVNIPKHNQFLEFLQMIFGLAAIIAAFYVILGLTVDMVAPYVPQSMENKMSSAFMKSFNVKGNEQAAKKLQALTDSLSSYTASGRKFNVYIIPDDQFNALAAPGGNILVFAGLLKQVTTENELAFVMAHEMGHFENKDHLKGLGRGIVLTFISTLFFGADSAVTNMITKVMTSANLKFSRDQESKADVFAAGIIEKKYGHAEGAVSMLRKFEPFDSKMPKFLYYFTTHPYYTDRIKTVIGYIEENGFKTGKQKKADGDYAGVNVNKVKSIKPGI